MNRNDAIRKPSWANSRSHSAVVDAAVPERDAEHQQRVDRHDHGGEALDQPIHAGRNAPRPPAGALPQAHSHDQRQGEADDEHDGARPARGFEIDSNMQIEQQVTDAGAEVMQVRPHEADKSELGDRMRKGRLQVRKRFGRGEAARRRRRAAAGCRPGTERRPIPDAGSKRSPAMAAGCAADRGRPGVASRFRSSIGHGSVRRGIGKRAHRDAATRQSRPPFLLCKAAANYSLLRAL